ncbi:hypothetical protein [Nostoc sp. PCC 7107]|nr:hypothetical protein [Nostoc sp. PCC 7107]
MLLRYSDRISPKKRSLKFSEICDFYSSNAIALHPNLAHLI